MRNQKKKKKKKKKTQQKTTTTTTSVHFFSARSTDLDAMLCGATACCFVDAHAKFVLYDL